MLILVTPVSILWATFQQVILGSPIGNNPTNDYMLSILALVLGVGFPLFIYHMGLDTEVRESGVHIRFRPFHRKWRMFGFDNIKGAEELIYSPLWDYGGWGIRKGKKGKAYNVSGNKGVLLTLHKGESVLIGSKDHVVLCRKINESLSASK